MKIRVIFPGGNRYKKDDGTMGFWPPGAVVETSDGYGALLIHQGRAVAVAEEPEAVIETAEAAPAPERAVKRTTKPKPRTRK